MTNKLGVVKTINSHKMIVRYKWRERCGNFVTESVIDLPEIYNDVEDGLIAYIDHNGVLQLTDGDPND